MPKVLTRFLKEKMSQQKYECTCGWSVYGKGSVRKSKARGNCGEPWCPVAVEADTVRTPSTKVADKAPAAVKGPTPPKPSAKVKFNDDVAHDDDDDDEKSASPEQTDIDEETEESEEFVTLASYQVTSMEQNGSFNIQRTKS